MTLEYTIEEYLIVTVNSLGGEIRKVKWLGRRGAPDRVIMLPAALGKGETIWVEVKKPGGLATFPKGELERAQYREHERMRKMGQRVEVIDSFEGVDELLGIAP